MNTAAPQGIEIASAKNFCDFRAREGSPAAIFHENFEISNFAPDLELPKSHLHEFFWGTPAQPKSPAHISQQSDGRISKTIVGIQSTKPKRHRNARNFCSPIFRFEAPATVVLLGRLNLNRLYKSCVSKIGKACCFSET